MTTRKELQEWLNRFPEDTLIEVGIQKEPHGYDSYGQVVFEPLILKDSDYGDGWEFHDYSKNKFVNPDEYYYGKSILTLGESN